MLSCVPPTKEAIENMRRSSYCGASSGYKPAKVITEDSIIVNDIKSMNWSRIGEKSDDDFYTCHLGNAVGTKITQYGGPTVAITSNSNISDWDTDADIVFDNSTNNVYFLDKAGCVTEDAAQAESVVWAKTKNGHKVMLYQQPCSVLQAYQKDDVVEKDGQVYHSNVNDNVWAPDLIESHMAELRSEITRLKAERAIHSQLIETINMSFAANT